MAGAGQQQVPTTAAGGAAAGSAGFAEPLPAATAAAPAAAADIARMYAGQGQQQQQRWHWRHVGLGRQWKQQQQQQLFVAEPASAVLSSLQVALQVLVAAAEQPDTSVSAAADAGAADSVGCEQQGGAATASTADADRSGVPQDPQLSAAAAAADAVDATAARKLAVLGELLAQWVVSHADDLSAVLKVLQGIVQAEKQYTGFRDLAARIVGVAQQQVQQRYGFTVALAG